MATKKLFQPEQILYVINVYQGKVVLPKDAIFFNNSYYRVYIKVDDSIRVYNYNDLNRLFFPNFDDAIIATKKFPSIGDEVWMIKENQIFNSTIKNIEYAISRGISTLAISLSNGMYVLYYEIGKKLFLSKEDAELYLNKKN